MKKEKFLNGLKNNNIEVLKKIDKTDLHNHGAFSCTRDYIEDNGIILPYYKVSDIESLNLFIRSHIKPIIDDIKKLPILLKGNFENCRDTGIKFVAPSIDYKTCINLFNSNTNIFISFLKKFQYQDLNIFWTLGISIDSYIHEHKSIIIEMIETQFFSAIDLYGVEDSKPNNQFIDFYNLANDIGIITKVHIGEQFGAKYILDCINDLNPKEIQHGIRIIENKKVVKLVKKKKIIFNICPTSNIILNYAKSIQKHPIKIMYKYGLLTTLATDDLLFFKSDINNEYLKLFNNNVLTAKQLNKIRKNGLKIVRNYKNNNYDCKVSSTFSKNFKCHG